MQHVRETALSGPVENLGLLFQEILTAIARLRSNRHQVTNAEVFRSQVLHTLKKVDQDALARGYAEEDVKLATFAIVAFLDESILNLRQPVFEDWVRKPLQEELFGRHIAGEVFFSNLEIVLGRRDAPEVADVAEVYYLCLLLGYLGKYSISSKSELRELRERTGEKIQRIRNGSRDLSPAWALPTGTGLSSASDQWLRPLLIVLAACALLPVLLFPLYRISLGSAIDGLSQLASMLVSRGRP
jgi:type VI secretion system protein ImpK